MPKLSTARKKKMMTARAETSQQRKAAIAALQNNPQFTHPKLWTRICPELAENVVKAIRRSQKIRKKAELAKLEAKVAALKEELGA